MVSPAPKLTQEIQEVPLKIVGGNKFGRYSKISIEETFNMIVSDNALVDYAGYKNILTQSSNQAGRGIFTSVPGNFMICVWGNEVFKINPDLTADFIHILSTDNGDVFIAENNNKQIAITDEVNLYVYNYGASPPTFTTLSYAVDPVAFPIKTPGYISFQAGLLLIADLNTQNWYLSGYNDATTWSTAPTKVGALQSKPDTIQAAVPTPGGGNNLLLFGHNVVEQWQFIGGSALFPYQRSSTFNVDYGCLNASSIAALDTFVVWLAANEQGGATIMICSGNQAQTISTDGIDFKLANLTNPTNCTGFLFRQDGHLLYQFTFPDDNLSYVYDYDSKLFFTVTDENFNYHIARNVVYFNDNYYFVSLNGGNLYQFGTQYTNFQYAVDDIREIPRVRITPPLRLPSQRMFIIKSVGFTVENGRPNLIQTFTRYARNPVGQDIQTEGGTNIATESGIIIDTEGSPATANTITVSSMAIDLSISRDGGETFGASWRYDMNPVGVRKSRVIWQRCGQANDATFQFRFWGFERFVAMDGIIEAFQ